MTMTHEEIIRDYKQASNKQKQVRILADLNCVSPSEILTISAENGVEGVKMPSRIMPRKQPVQAPASPSHTGVQAGGDTVYGRIETILGAVPEDATQYMRSNAVNLVVSMFTDYVEKRLGKETRHDA